MHIIDKLPASFQKRINKICDCPNQCKQTITVNYVITIEISDQYNNNNKTRQYRIYYKPEWNYGFYDIKNIWSFEAVPYERLNDRVKYLLQEIEKAKST